ncbi:uncharacterized protein LOC134818889 isoform X2 [Bolinopsis microptera]|uniref:uncharacterized protein LOC134818889 isoform X2 n=1 Tax=Bolinopsis microptera TaxID=2820187 RepID=UPI003079E1ED
MKEKENSNWDQNLQMMTGRPLSICEEEDLKQRNILESDKLVPQEVLFRPNPKSLAIMEESFDMSVQPVVNHYQKSNSKPVKTGKKAAKVSSKKAKNIKKMEELYQKQKSVDKRVTAASEVECLCCAINGTCVGTVGVVLLIALAIALLSVPGAGRMPESVPIYIRDYTDFMTNYNDSNNYTFRVLKHIRSYMRYAFLRKPDLPRTYISVSFQLGWIDDHLLNISGIIKLLFDRLPYESFYRRNANTSDFFGLIHRSGGTFSYNVGSCVSQVDISIPNSHLRELLEIFSRNYGFGHTSVPKDLKSFELETIKGEVYESYWDLLPARPEYDPKFSTGSISTLNRTDIQDRLWDFYDRYYSANLITVAIIGNETLDTLQEWAEEIFTAIPNKEKTKPVFNQLPFPPGDKRYISRAIYYQPKSDKDSIKLIFPINISDYPNLSYLTYLMGYEGKGSLYQYLSTRGYVTSLMSAISTEAQNFVLVSVSCDLTEKGLTKPKDIVRALFQFVKRVKANGVNEQLWKENKQIDELKFKFKEKEDPATYASTISAHMARVTDPRDFLDPPSRRIYNQSLEERIMAHITPDNFNMYISSLKLSTEMANKYGPQLTQKETWYSTPYENLQIDEADITNWETVELNEDLYLPETNPFIPDDFNIKEYEGKALPVTVNATEVSDMTVWWYQDKEFNQPKLYMGCRIQPKPATPSVKNGLLSEMLSSTYLRETSESLYPAVSVDYDIGFLFDDFWIMTLSGFSDAEKVKKVIESGLDSLFQLDFDQNEEHFNATIREPIRKEYLNVKNWMPAQLSLRYARMIQDQYIFSYSENLAELDSLAQSDIRNLRDDFLKDISIDCSIMGNVIEQQSAEYSEILKNKLVTGAGSTIVKENRLDAFVHPIFKLPQNKTLVVRQKVENPEEPNSGVLSLFQIGPVESNGPYTDRLPYTRFVLATLLGLMMREPCFNYLRTQQQLGYVASCFEEEFKNIMVFNILVQGSREDAGAYVIAEQHDIFVDLQYNKFLEQSKSDAGLQLWADIKVALRKQIEEKPISLSEKNTQFNREIFSPTRDFVRREKKVAALEEITMDDFIEFYKRYLIGENRRKISSQVYGKNDEMPETVNDERNEELILDIQAYRSKLTETYTGDE